MQTCMNLSSQEEPNLLHPAHALPRFCTHSPTPNSTARSADKSCKQTTDPSTPGSLTPRQTLQPSNMHNQTMQLKMTLKNAACNTRLAVASGGCGCDKKRLLPQIQCSEAPRTNTGSCNRCIPCQCDAQNLLLPLLLYNQTSNIRDTTSQSEVVEAGWCYIATSQTQPVHPADLKQLQTAVKVPHATLVHTARWLKDAPAAVVV